jgi:hypothetical protein
MEFFKLNKTPEETLKEWARLLNFAFSNLGFKKWISWTPNGAGYTAGGARYLLVEKLCFIIIDSTANITANITNLPYKAANYADCQLTTNTGTAVIAKDTSTITVATNPQNISGFYEIA